jgi:hypothetical protein
MVEWQFALALHHYIRNDGVGGSIPSRGTIFYRVLATFD